MDIWAAHPCPPGHLHVEQKTHPYIKEEQEITDPLGPGGN